MFLREKNIRMKENDVEKNREKNKEKEQNFLKWYKKVHANTFP